MLLLVDLRDLHLASCPALRTSPVLRFGDGDAAEFRGDCRRRHPAGLHYFRTRHCDRVLGCGPDLRQHPLVPFGH